MYGRDPLGLGALVVRFAVIVFVVAWALRQSALWIEESWRTLVIVLATGLLLGALVGWLRWRNSGW